MGLFGNKKCPICGGNIGLLKLELVDNNIICNDCKTKISAAPEIVKKLTLEDVKENITYWQKIKEKFKNEFKVSKEVDAGEFLLFEDEVNGLWAYTLKSNSTPIMFTYDDLISFEYIENGKTITEGGLGSAILGGALFGGVGAVVGSNLGKKSKEEIQSMAIRISVQHKYFYQLYLNFLKLFSVEAGTTEYNNKYQNVMKAMSFFEVIASKKSQKYPIDKTSDAEEILKFKELLNKGIITQEEFDAKKKQLLGL